MPPVAPSEPGAPAPARADRWPIVAALEVLLCSGLPTQLAIGQSLAAAGWSPFSASGEPQTTALFALALVDSVAILTLVLLLLRSHGESARELFIGRRPMGREALLGVACVPLLFLGVGVVVVTLRHVLPWVHNVPTNPFERLVQTPAQAGGFALVAIVAGGLREEVQRAFLLHRFEHHLGGARVGLVLVSVAFGAGHVMQGWDAAIATGLLGFAWGWLFLARRSAVAPVVSHAAYNMTQVLQLLALRALQR